MPEASPDKPAETPAATPDPEKVKLAADAEEARRRASLAEQQAAYARGALEASQRNVPQPQRQTPQGPDPLDRYAKENLTLAPDDQKALLDQAIRQRAAAMTNESMRQMDQRRAAERAADESARALEMVTWMKPELQRPENVPNFGASITKAKMEAEMQGVQLTPAQLAQRAAQIFDQTFNPKPTPTPFVEGANRGMVEGQPQPKQEESVLEKTYGMKGKIRPMFDVKDDAAVTDLNLEYIRRKNEPLFKKGVNSGMNEVWATRENS